MTSELFGMFFVAEDVYNADSTGRPLELTCYRRNLWQCSGQITLPRHVAHLISEQGLQIPVVELAASITAIESIEGKPTEIISIPWKSSNPNNNNNNNNNPANLPGGQGDDVKVAGAPPTLPLDLSSGQELDSSRVSIPVSWKRLQFKHATANNGRRKGLQQHYVVQINLLGKTKTGEWMKIAEIQSGPVIVRGRSPRNFDSRKDVPLSGDKKLERRSLSSENTATVASVAAAGSGAGTPHKQDRGDLAQNLGRYHSLGNIQVSHPVSNHLLSSPLFDLTDSSLKQTANPPPPKAAAHCRKQSTGGSDWSSSQSFAQSPSHHPSKKMAISPNLQRPPVPAWSSDGSASSGRHLSGPTTVAKTFSQPGGQTLPINLSLSEDERSPNRTGVHGGGPSSPQFAKSAPGGAGGGPGESPMENGDMLYEYFPLSLDDW